METVSNLVISHFTAERSPRNSVDETERDEQPREHHRNHRVEHARGQGLQHGLERRPDIDDQQLRIQEPDERSTALTYRRSERTTLMLETQEGDTVRLKITASESLAVDIEQSEDGDTAISEVELQARSRTRISIKVNGSLNEEELAAIQDIVAQAGELADDFFAGNIADAFAAASALEVDATQLANVRIRMKSSEQLTYTGSRNAAIRPAELQAPAVSEPAAATEGEPVTAPAETIDPDTQTVAVDGTESVTPEQAVQVADEANVSDPSETTGREQLMANVLQTIGEFLNRLINSFSNETDTEQGSSVASYDMTLKLHVFQSMLLSIKEIESPESGSALPDLVPETIDALAAQQVPLDEVA